MSTIEENLSLNLLKTEILQFMKHSHNISNAPLLIVSKQECLRGKSGPQHNAVLSHKSRDYRLLT